MSGFLVRPDVQFSPDSSLLVLSRENNQLFRFDGKTGAFAELMVSNEAGQA